MKSTIHFIIIHQVEHTYISQHKQLPYNHQLWNHVLYNKQSFKHSLFRRVQDLSI
jgi:hypothetical protein